MRVAINHGSKNYSTTISFDDVKINHNVWLKHTANIKDDLRKSQRKVNQQLKVKDSDIAKIDELKAFFDDVAQSQNLNSRANRNLGIKTRGMTKRQIAKQARKNATNRDKVGALATNFVKSVAGDSGDTLTKLSASVDKTKRVGEVITNNGSFKMDGKTLAKALNVGSVATDALSSVFPEIAAVTRGLSLVASGLVKTKALKAIAPTSTAARNVITKVNKTKASMPESPDELVKQARSTLYSPENMKQFSPKQQQEIQQFLNKAKGVDLDGAILSKVPGIGEFNKLKRKGSKIAAAGSAINGAYEELKMQLVGYQVANGHNSPTEYETTANLANLEASMETKGVSAKFNKKTTDGLRDVLSKMPDYAKKNAQDYIKLTDELDPASAIARGDGGSISVDFEQLEDEDTEPITSSSSTWTGKEPSHDSDIFKFWTGQLDTDGPKFDDIIKVMKDESGALEHPVWGAYTDAFEKVHRYFEHLFGNGPLKLDDWLTFKINSGKLQYVNDEWWFQSTSPEGASGESKGFLDMMRDLKEALIELGSNVPDSKELDALLKVDNSHNLSKLDTEYAKNEQQLEIEQTTNDKGYFDPIGFRNYLNS